RVHVFHFNDTQIPLGGHRDRHWHIGEGNIGYEGFRALAAHPELNGKTAILETPGEPADDARNLRSIRMLFGSP
ncbi:MAG TPA: TIM barrel protein, partial [Candidatus Baltobacteraceae bacterium]|nr:TIM barrel protein [Candidatus Baltobacteraceae bacterium]